MAHWPQFSPSYYNTYNLCSLVFYLISVMGHFLKIFFFFFSIATTMDSGVVNLEEYVTGNLIIIYNYI